VGSSDDVKGGALDPQKVMQATSKELEYLRGQGVYEYATKAEAKAVTGKAPIRLKWIDSNKGRLGEPQLQIAIGLHRGPAQGDDTDLLSDAAPGGHPGAGGEVEQRGPVHD